MPTNLISDVGYEIVKRPQGPRARADIRLNNQRKILGDRTNVGASCSYVPIVDGVKQWTPGSNRLTKKNLKRPNLGPVLPCSQLTVVQQQIPYKKGRKDTAHSVLTPENFNLVLHAVINPKIAHHGGGWSESKQPLIDTSVVPVSEPPAETVTVQPDGGIQHVLGDPQDAPLPELTDEDLEGLTDVPLWPSALLEQLDFTPAHWIDPPATSVGGTASAEPVNHQPAAPASGSRAILIQASIHNPPGTVSPYAQGAVATLLPDGSAAADEYIAGGLCTKCCKDCVDKLTVVTTAVDVNSLTIGRQCKLGALSVKLIFSDFRLSKSKRSSHSRPSGKSRTSS
ncbi:uncharacterized protein LOC130378480 isoform X2 [Gadus chalcogrammus]|uniref:uncharacterized protein LOC130378480 isoform X2 n=1 Tax=Gadus chalcogrammus TaxID=1042646 RepID=UPI0024C41901|nr:uncharacterized protein LOC130378480 isoform X2 [Gadus chalcogrammus]